jgi:acyl dehydratase
VTQADIDAFAQATGDHQWIHVDPQRAAASPFGGTIAHGYLTLALVPTLLGRLLAVGGVAMGLNYGLNRVRFPSPLPSGTRVRLAATLADAKPVSGGVEVTLDATLEREGGDKPVCVAQVIYRFYAQG